MSQTLCFFTGNILNYTGTPEEFKRMLWLDYVKSGHGFVLEDVAKVWLWDQVNEVWWTDETIREMVARAVFYSREYVPHADTKVRPKKKEKVMEPGDYVLGFSKWKGEKLSELPVDAVPHLLKWEDLYAGPRAKIEAYIAWLRANPERGWMNYGKYEGRELSEVPTHYLDFEMGRSDGTSPLLIELMGRVRDARRVHSDVYYDDPNNDVVFARLRTVDLSRVPYDTEAMIPSDEYENKPRPSGWYISRKFDKVADALCESSVTQPAEKRAAYPVMFAPVELVSGDGGETWKVPADDPRDEKGKLIKQKRQPGVRETRSLVRANDANRERVEHWAFVLECIDKLEYAGEDDLEDAYEDAKAAVANLEECERVDARTLDVHAVYQNRKDALDAGETLKCDVPYTKDREETDACQDDEDDRDPRERKGGRRRRVCYLEKFKESVELCELGRRARSCESVAEFDELCVGLDKSTVKKLYRAYYGAGLHLAPMCK